MQYAKIRAGVEYLVSNSNTWATRSNSHIARVRVLSTDKYRGQWKQGGGTEWVVSPERGDMIHVVLIYDDGTDGQDFYVSTRNIRDTWAEGNAKREAELKRQRDAAYARRAKLDAGEKAAHELEEQANKLGLKIRARNETGWKSDVPNWTFKMTQDDLADWVAKQS